MRVPRGEWGCGSVQHLSNLKLYLIILTPKHVAHCPLLDLSVYILLCHGDVSSFLKIMFAPFSTQYPDIFRVFSITSMRRQKTHDGIPLYGSSVPGYQGIASNEAKVTSSLVPTSQSIAPLPLPPPQGRNQRLQTFVTIMSESWPVSQKT